MPLLIWTLELMNDGVFVAVLAVVIGIGLIKVIRLALEDGYR